jgi:uncharacterized membrane protein
MNQKQIGTILIIIGILLGGFVYFAKSREDAAIKLFVQEQGSCFLEDGTCLHASQEISLYIIGWILSAALIVLGGYLIFFDKTQKVLAEHQLKVSSALQEAKKDDKFEAFLAGFPKDEQDILKAIKEQEGIQQATLRFRTGISKTKLSLLLKSLEEREIISRKSSGKTNEVYLRKKF